MYTYCMSSQWVSRVSVGGQLGVSDRAIETIKSLLSVVSEDLRVAIGTKPTVIVKCAACGAWLACMPYSYSS